jgi:hypothetical protein
MYRYSFDFARLPEQKSLDKDTACAMLTLMLQDRWALLPDLLEFLKVLPWKSHG